MTFGIKGKVKVINTEKKVSSISKYIEVLKKMQKRYHLVGEDLAKVPFGGSARYKNLLDI